MSDGADEAKLFGDVGEDEVGGGLGQVEELLHAFHVAAAGEAAGADGDERLVDVEACALRVGVGIEKDQHALSRQETRRAARPAAGRVAASADEQILPLHAGQNQHHGGDAGRYQRGAQVGLLDDEQDKDDGHDGGAQQRVLPVAHGVEAGVQKPGQKQHQHRLGDLRGLKGEEAAEANPAMGVVRAGKEEDQHQQQGGDAESGIDEARGFVDVCSRCA